MSQFLLNLPLDIPWNLIAVSPDMMDTRFGDQQFPFAWRSSLAISAFEPKPNDLPEDLCEQRITYLKVTATITGYQPSKDETDNAYVEFASSPGYELYPNIEEKLNRIMQEYFGCYGVQLNVAVFPTNATMRKNIKRSIDFSRSKPNTKLSNPYQRGNVIFETLGHPENQIVDKYPQRGDRKGELDIFQKLTVSLPPSYKVEAKVRYGDSPSTPMEVTNTLGRSFAAGVPGITMDVYKGTVPVGSKKSELQVNQLHTLSAEGEGITRVEFWSHLNEASLLEFAYYTMEDVPIELKDYPHIVDFEPKIRDLYQSATESGEILTASNSDVHTGKSFVRTESTETGLSQASKLITGSGDGAIVSENASNLSHKWGDTNQDTSIVQTDASRDRRERHTTNTSLSQMYNLLTGYHPGTNRVVFLMLPRPHILQPTDHRTFIQGLRVIEGVQEFFLIVSRPIGMESLCVEAYLETGHFPEEARVEVDAEKYNESHEDFTVHVHANGGILSGETKQILADPSATHHVMGGWVIDRSKGDPNHPGISEISNNNNEQADQTLRGYNYQPNSDSTVIVMGSIHGQNGFGSGAIFDRTYRVFIRSENPIPNSSGSRVTTPFLITSRGLNGCFRSGEKCLKVLPLAQAVPTKEPPVDPVIPHPEPETQPIAFPTAPLGTPNTPLGTPTVDTMRLGSLASTLLERPVIREAYRESIVDERFFEVTVPAVRSDGMMQTRLPAMKEMLRQIQYAMSTSWRARSRLARGTVGFFESDYFTNQILNTLPKGTLEKPIDQIENLPNGMTELLGKQFTVENALKLDLVQFAKKSGLVLADAAKVRRRLLAKAHHVQSDMLAASKIKDE